jgi:hypothetical protein
MCSQSESYKTGSTAHVPNRHSNIIQGFQKLQIASAACRISERFWLLELPLPEIRSELDRHTSNAGMLQSGTPHLARCQEFGYRGGELVFFRDNQEA